MSAQTRSMIASGLLAGLLAGVPSALLAAATHADVTDRFCTTESLLAAPGCDAACAQPSRVRGTEVDGVRHLMWTPQSAVLAVTTARSVEGGGWEFGSIALPQQPLSVDVRGSLAAIGHGTNVSVLRLVDGLWTTETTFGTGLPNPSRAIAVGTIDGVERIAVGASTFPLFGGGSPVRLYRNDSSAAGPASWILEETFEGSTGVLGASFGAAIALDGNRLAIAEPAVFAGEAGPIRVHELIDSGWTLASTIERPAWLEGQFGNTLALHGDTLAARSVSTPRGVQLFQRTEGAWMPMAYLQGQGANQTFGIDLSIAPDGDVLRLAIGLALPNGNDGAVLSAGWMYRLEQGVVLSVTPLRAPIGGGVDANARSVSIVSAIPMWIAMACPVPGGSPATIRVAERDTPDCDGDGVPDACAIIDDPSLDGNLNGVPDSCETILGDLDGNGTVDGADLGLLLGAWGQSGGAGDLNGDGTVDGADLGALLGAWTP